MASIAADARPPNARTQPSAFLSGGSSQYRLSWLALGSLAAVGMTVLLIGLGTSRVLTYHEMVYAEPAREMLASGNFILPRIVGVPFTDKPPLGAWAIAFSMALFRSEAEWVVRLPSVLAALATAIIIALVAARWFGSRIGLIAGLMQITMVHVSMQARLAEVDTLLALTVAGAMALFGLAQVESPHVGKLSGRWVPWAFHACLGLSFMSKFMAGPAFVIAGCGLFLLVRRDVRGILRFCFDPLGLLIFGLITIPWIVAVHLEYPAWIDTALSHNLGRFGDSLGLNEPAWAYFYQVPVMTLPWSPLAIFGVVQGVRRGLHHDARWQWLACWFLGGIIVLSLMAFKTKHYPIPILTPLAVCGAWGLNDYLTLRRQSARSWSFVSMGLVVVGTTIAILVLDRSESRSSQETREIQFIVGVIGLGLIGMWFCEWLRRPRAQMVSMFALSAIVSVLVQVRVMPYHDSYRHQTEFAKIVNLEHVSRAGHDQTLTLVSLPDNQVTFYLDPPLARYDNPPDYFTQVDASQDTSPSTRLVLAPAWFEAELRDRGEVDVLATCSRWNKYQTADDRLTLFTWSTRLNGASPGR